MCAWLAEPMTSLGTAITEQIAASYGVSGFLSRLSDSVSGFFSHTSI